MNEVIRIAKKKVIFFGNVSKYACIAYRYSLRYWPSSFKCVNFKQNQNRHFCTRKLDKDCKL